MAEQPNKPGADFKDDGTTQDAGDEQAVKNQSTTTPDAYPDDEGGKPDYGTPHTRPEDK